MQIRAFLSLVAACAALSACGSDAAAGRGGRLQTTPDAGGAQALTAAAGCAATQTPGCGGCACEACVCASDTFCCSTSWDDICVQECKSPCNMNCVAPPPDTPPAGSAGCVATQTKGCGGCACETCVCAKDPFCCGTAWDALCVGECQADCGMTCGGTGGLVAGCAPKATPGCNGCACETCVCAADTFCCGTAWDELCVQACQGTCGMSCTGGPAKCGDGQCAAGEAASCPADCAQSTTTVLGFVKDGTGLPVAGVAVTAEGQSATSGADGKFSVTVPGQKATVVTLQKAGLAPSWHRVQPKGAPNLTLTVTMYAPTTTMIDVQSAPANIPVPGGVSVRVPAGSLRTATGAVPTGPVQAQVAWVSPAQAVTASPIPLVGTNGQETLPLQTFGMVDLRFDFQGQPLQIAPGSKLHLEVPASPSDPQTTGLFSADPVTGLWVQEGTATQLHGKWQADIPHLSWWNIDGFLKVPFDKQACVTFRALSSDGKGIPGVEIRSNWGPGGSFTIAGTTGLDGTLCSDQFPVNETLTIHYKSASGVVAEGDIQVTPTALKVKCGAPECQVVDIPLACKTDADCGPGIPCVNGACGGGGGGGPCVPKCALDQCTDDGCGKPCKECPKGQTCSPNSQKCEACVPNCSGQTCGSDGCNGSCGVCPAGQSCNGVQCVAACTFCPTGNCNAFGFEDGLAGWDVSGDVAVVDKFGAATPPAGAKMARLSTGLAFAAPSLAQRSLCASPNVTKLTFQWRFYSEEFKEFCGKQFQDFFRVKIVVGGAETELLKVTVDELCPAGENGCTTCGAKSVGLEESEIDFDKGGVWKTPWQTANLTLPAGAASGVLVFEVADVGDSSFDTVVILDAIQLSP